MKLKAVPQQLRLAIALQSISDPLAVNWLSTISPSIVDYEQFKIAFKRHFWSASKQSIVKCSVYSGHYREDSNVSMSDYFLEQAVLSSYLEPRMSDMELIDAMKFHFPIYVQNAFASAQLSTVQDAIDLLKRLEMIGSREKQRRYNSTASSQNQQYQGHRNGNNQRGINYHRDDRGNKNAQTQNVRQVSFSRPYQANRGRNNGTPYNQISQTNFHDLPRDRYNPHAREFTPRDGSEVHVNNSAQQQREEN
jgi:hypothetical protein